MDEYLLILAANEMATSPERMSPMPTIMPSRSGKMKMRVPEMMRMRPSKKATLTRCSRALMWNSMFWF